jgi:hypothetical protein
MNMFYHLCANLIQDPLEPVLHCNPAQVVASIRVQHMELPEPVQP